jgi:hypothetical protein
VKVANVVVFHVCFFFFFFKPLMILASWLLFTLNFGPAMLHGYIPSSVRVILFFTLISRQLTLRVLSDFSC